jgi:hypothetical protein
MNIWPTPGILGGFMTYRGSNIKYFKIFFFHPQGTGCIITEHGRTGNKILEGRSLFARCLVTPIPCHQFFLPTVNQTMQQEFGGTSAPRLVCLYH